MSNWNKIIKDVYADVVINKNTIRTESVDIKPEETKVIPAYWDTKNLNKGTYDAQLIVHYKNKIFEKSFDVLVSENKVEIKPAFNTKYIYVLLLIIFIIIFALFYQKKIKKST